MNLAPGDAPISRIDRFDKARPKCHLGVNQCVFWKTADGRDRISVRRSELTSGRGIIMNTAATAVVFGTLGLLVRVLGMADASQVPGPAAREPAGDHGGRADPHSFGNPEQVRVHRSSLDLTVDFEHRVLKGRAVLELVRQPGCPADAPLVLDSRGLTIEEVGLRQQEPSPHAFTPTTFQLDPAGPDPGLPTHDQAQSLGRPGPDYVPDEPVGRSTPVAGAVR